MSSFLFFFFSSRRRHTRFKCDWSSDVCSSDLGIEQQQVGTGANRNAAPVGDAVKPGLMAGQPTHAFRDVERSTLTHPMTKEIKPEAGIAQIDQMRARIGQRDDTGLVFDQRLDPVVDGIKEAPNEAGVEVLLEPEIE